MRLNQVHPMISIQCSKHGIKNGIFQPSLEYTAKQMRIIPVNPSCSQLMLNHQRLSKLESKFLKIHRLEIVCQRLLVMTSQELMWNSNRSYSIHRFIGMTSRWIFRTRIGHLSKCTFEISFFIENMGNGPVT